VGELRKERDGMNARRREPSNARCSEREEYARSDSGENVRCSRGAPGITGCYSSLGSRLLFPSGTGVRPVTTSSGGEWTPASTRARGSDAVDLDNDLQEA
jgi:hypothetical protein